jgi:hypothetical protein
MTRYYVGLDVHSKQSAFVIEDEGGKVIARGEVPTTAGGFRWLKATYQLETELRSLWRPRQLLSSLPVSSVDSGSVPSSSMRTKCGSRHTDPIRRAMGVTLSSSVRVCGGGSIRSIVHVARPEISRLRDTLSSRRHFVRLQAAQIGAVKALLRAAGLGRLSRSLGSEAGWARMIAALTQHSELRSYGEQHRALWRCTQEQITALDASSRQP